MERYFKPVVAILSIWTIIFNFLEIIPVIYLFFFMGWKAIIVILCMIFILCIWSRIVYPLLNMITCVNILFVPFMGKNKYLDIVLTLICQIINIGFHLVVSFAVFRIVYAYIIGVLFHVTFGSYILLRYHIVALLIAYIFAISGIQFLAGHEKNNSFSAMMLFFMNLSFQIMTIFSIFISDYVPWEFFILFIAGFIPILVSSMIEVHRDWGNR